MHDNWKQKWTIKLRPTKVIITNPYLVTTIFPDFLSPIRKVQPIWLGLSARREGAHVSRTVHQQTTVASQLKIWVPLHAFYPPCQKLHINITHTKNGVEIEREREKERERESVWERERDRGREWVGRRDDGITGEWQTEDREIGGCREKVSINTC